MNLHAEAPRADEISSRLTGENLLREAYKECDLRDDASVLPLMQLFF